MNLNFDFNGKTTLAKWWKIVKENFQKIVTAFNAEKTARETADATLEKRIEVVEKSGGGTGGSNCLNNHVCEYGSDDDTIIYITVINMLI